MAQISSSLSLNVTSLFTNIPLDLAIDGISKKCIHIQHYTKIPKHEFILALNFILTSIFFNFDNIIYKQIHGTSMGSSLSPIIANIVMQDLEEASLNKINLKLPFYYRYVDNIIMAAPSDNISQIYHIFNNYYDIISP